MDGLLFILLRICSLWPLGAVGFFRISIEHQFSSSLLLALGLGWAF